MNPRFLDPPSSSSYGISLKAVTLIRGGHTVFNRLTLSLHEARIGLVGDNGSGKSSLFRLLCGLEQPEHGKVIIHGCNAQSERRRLPQLVGLMFQNPDDQIIFPTVIEELAFTLSGLGVSRKDARQRARAFLAQRALSGWEERAIGELSQGQRQQVCLMALQIGQPVTLLLDEPFASLDLVSQARLAAQLAATSQQVSLSTHALEHVHDFERVLWLENGTIRADGPGQEVCTAYARDVRERAARGDDNVRSTSATLRNAEVFSA